MREAPSQGVTSSSSVLLCKDHLPTEDTVDWYKGHLSISVQGPPGYRGHCRLAQGSPKYVCISVLGTPVYRGRSHAVPRVDYRQHHMQEAKGTVSIESRADLAFVFRWRKCELNMN